MKRQIIVAIILIVVIALFWFVFDNRSPYPMSPDELLNAANSTSTQPIEIDSSANNSSTINNNSVAN